MQRFPSDSEPDEFDGVYACATPGHRVADVLARIDSDLVAVEPDCILVAIGTNDAAHKGHPSTPVDKFEQDYRKVLRRCLSVTRNVVILTAPNVYGEACGYTNDELSEINDLLCKLAKEYETDVIDLFGVLEGEHFVGDGVHPNAQGHERIFRHVYDSLAGKEVR